MNAAKLLMSEEDLAEDKARVEGICAAGVQEDQKNADQERDSQQQRGM
jgi:hypothetical protein